MTVTTEVASDVTPARARFIAARLLVAGDAFFFLGFLFAYLYLRALDSNDNWHPPNTDPSLALGTVSLVAIVAAAAVLRLGGDRRLRSGTLLALALTLVATVCWGVQLFDPGFSPSHAGGYGAVFVGFAAAMLAHMLGAVYWLETIAVDSATTEEQLRQELGAALVFTTFLAGVAVVAYILIYLV
jgi:heme/copper-type cytochrome/quinol oxidase subunit 3